jgi:hypothetical protein
MSRLVVSATDVAVATASKDGTLRFTDGVNRFGDPYVALEDEGGLIEVFRTRAEAENHVDMCVNIGPRYRRPVADPMLTTRNTYDVCMVCGRKIRATYWAAYSNAAAEFIGQDDLTGIDDGWLPVGPECRHKVPQGSLVKVGDGNTHTADST